jgi:hypothetical protein
VAVGGCRPSESMQAVSRRGLTKQITWASVARGEAHDSDSDSDRAAAPLGTAPQAMAAQEATPW